jgi:hypothetical protein
MMVGRGRRRDGGAENDCCGKRNFGHARHLGFSWLTRVVRPAVPCREIGTGIDDSNSPENAKPRMSWSLSSGRPFRAGPDGSSGPRLLFAMGRVSGAARVFPATLIVATWPSQ